MADWTQFAIDYMPIEIAINLPAAVLADPDFVRRMRRQLPRPSGIQPAGRGNRQQRVDRRDRARAGDVRGLGSAGIGVSIDNLGTECSSLVGLEGFRSWSSRSRASRERLRAGSPEAGAVRHHSRHRAAARRPHGRGGRGDARRSASPCARWASTWSRGSCSASRWTRESSRARCGGPLTVPT